MTLRLIKFGLVGITGMVIDFSITILLKEKLRVHRYLASSLGFITAASSNYILNRNWTFHSSNPSIAKEYLYFMAVSLTGLLVNNIFLMLFEKRLKFYPAKVAATAASFIWNFMANTYITFPS